uniref:Gelsolin-like domain-containing protein n=1 Tax=Norrisiella sphaerica TaxID=552664 RepID=A0A7S2QRY3_9EUKA
MTETGYRCSPNVARIFQNREPEEFLELFDTGIVILAPPDGGDIAPPPPPMPSGDKMGSAHLEEQQPGLSAGKSDAISPKTESAMRFWRRMFHIRGASETLSRTHEVPCECSSLNSTDAFVVQETTSKFFIWYGALCSKIERTRAARAAVHIYSNLTEREDEEEEEEEIDLDRVFITVHEGKEPDRFWEAVGGKGNYTKFEASDTDQIANERLQNPILFEITLNRHYLMPRPILDYTSEDLHDSGVYMLDLHMWLFVWIGRRASERLVDGSMELAKAVVADRKGSKVVAVQAGKEPPEFTHAFLGWHEVRPFCDPYAKRAEKLAELGVVGRVLDVVPEDVQILREKRCKKEKKYRMNLTTGASTHYM